MKAAYCTLGCKVNQYDTQAMRELMENAGYDTVDFEDEADVYIVNTCTVTGEAEKKTRKAVRRALKKLRQTRQSKPMLQTGFLSVDAPDADTLIVRRYAVKGRDVFGKPLGGRAVTVKISR